MTLLWSVYYSHGLIMYLNQGVYPNGLNAETQVSSEIGESLDSDGGGGMFRPFPRETVVNPFYGLFLLVS